MWRNYDIKKSVKSVILLLLVFVGIAMNTSAQEFKKVVDLNQRWKFSVGDNSEWASPNFDDSNWERINVPSSWENQGFYGYDGYAWYRTNFLSVDIPLDQSLYLNLGNIDDVDEVFVNGQRIGQTGSFPPRFSTAYTSNRLYHLPAKFIKKRNTIAVRVYDDVGEGGIISGDISLMIDRDAIPVDIDLQGNWKFKTGKYAHENIAQMENWDDIIVPGYWENQGYKNYNGYACYALEFSLEKEVLKERMVLVLGKIDDIDQVYVNGVLVGQSGEFTEQTVRERSESYKQMRGYYLPVNLLRSNEKNRIIVRVFDMMEGGGIYTGSVGLLSQDNYIKYWNARRKR
ncbi:beta galactosidase jelly roll domain-containing protein [Marinifilum sp. RC60d5]|uniref:beta galactosidase jelly roll domain-containing protein n=1 Tax=Marinifilum sp. RC60d5 TaxID=3458414 RepID=UPI004036C08C